MTNTVKRMGEGISNLLTSNVVDEFRENLIKLNSAMNNLEDALNEIIGTARDLYPKLLFFSDEFALKLLSSSTNVIAEEMISKVSIYA
jgi:hypothetical protein